MRCRATGTPRFPIGYRVEFGVPEDGSGAAEQHHTRIPGRSVGADGPDSVQALGEIAAVDQQATSAGVPPGDEPVGRQTRSRPPPALTTGMARGHGDVLRLTSDGARLPAYGTNSLDPRTAASTRAGPDQYDNITAADRRFWA